MVNPTDFELEDDLVHGFRVAIITTLLMFVLELMSVQTVVQMLDKQPRLYLAGWLTTLRNNFILGPVTAYVAFKMLCANDFNDTTRSVKVGLGVVLIHALGYYTAHRAMHTKALYWAHKFHHRFNESVPPTSANAVSLAEYGIAYMLPFILAGVLLRPDVKSMYLAASIVSFNNLLIHTPPLETLATFLLPKVFVSTGKHLEHHRLLTKNYAAPTVNVDLLLSSSSIMTRLADRFFLAVGGRPVAVQKEKQ